MIATLRALWHRPPILDEAPPPAQAPVGPHYLSREARAAVSERAEALGKLIAQRRAARAGMIEQRSGNDRRQGERRRGMP